MSAHITIKNVPAKALLLRRAVREDALHWVNISFYETHSHYYVVSEDMERGGFEFAHSFKANVSKRAALAYWNELLRFHHLTDTWSL